MDFERLMSSSPEQSPAPLADNACSPQQLASVPRVGPAAAGSSNPILSEVAPAGESKEESSGFGDTADAMAQGFSTLTNGMDFVEHLHGDVPTKGTTGTKALGGTLGMIWEGLASGAEIKEGIEEGEHGEKGKAAADITKGGAGLVGAASEGFETMANAMAFGDPEHKEFYEGKAHGANVLSSATSAVGDGIQGVEDIVGGYGDYEKAKKVDDQAGGVTRMAKGGIETAGAASEAGLALTGTEALSWGSDLATVGATTLPGLMKLAGPVASSLATGLQVGHSMEGIAKQSDLYDHQNGSDITSKWVQDAAEWVDPSSIGPDGKVHQGGQSVGAKIVGGLASVLTSPVGAAIDAASTLDAGAHWLWNKL